MPQDLQIELVTRCAICNREGRLSHSGITPLAATVDDSLVDLKLEFHYCTTDSHLWLHNRPVSDQSWTMYQDFRTHSKNAEPGRKFEMSPKDLEKSLWRWATGYGPNSVTRICKLTSAVTRSLSRFPGQSPGASRFVWLIQQCGRNAAVLDVGAGDGSFVELMRNLGLDAVGYEPDPIAQSNFPSSLKPHIREGALEDLLNHEQRFDLIFLSHVIEHLYDPQHTVALLAQLLSPMGHLLITTPNGGSLGHRNLGMDWPQLEPGRHTHIFSARSLSRLLSKDFSIDKIWTTSRRARWSWNSAHFGFSRRRNGSRFVSLGGVLGQIVESAAELLPLGVKLGEELMVVAGPRR